MSMGAKQSIAVGVTVGVVLKLLDWAVQFLPSGLEWLGAGISWFWNFVKEPVSVPWTILVGMIVLGMIETVQLDKASKTLVKLRTELEASVRAKHAKNAGDSTDLCDEERAVLQAIVSGDGIVNILNLGTRTGLRRIRLHHGLEKLAERRFIEKVERRGEQFAQLADKGREYVVKNNIDLSPEAPKITE